VAFANEGAKVNQPSVVTKPIPQPRFGSGVICYYCKQPGHLKSECRKRLAKLAAQSSEFKAEESVNFVAIVPSLDPVEVVDPRYKNHCVEALLTRPDNASRPIKILRDTDAL